MCSTLYVKRNHPNNYLDLQQTTSKKSTNKERKNLGNDEKLFITDPQRNKNETIASEKSAVMDEETKFNIKPFNIRNKGIFSLVYFM